MSAKAEAIREANELFEVWERACEGERLFPVEPDVLAESVGIDVFAAELPKGVSGALVVRPHADPAIFVDATDNPQRQRFTSAHELGHYVRRAGAGDQDFQTIDYRDGRASTGTDTEEIFANTFAAALLMPEAHVRELHPKHETIAALASVFGVNYDAMRYRLLNLKLV